MKVKWLETVGNLYQYWGWICRGSQNEILIGCDEIEGELWHIEWRQRSVSNGISILWPLNHMFNLSSADIPNCRCSRRRYPWINCRISWQNIVREDGYHGLHNQLSEALQDSAIFSIRSSCYWSGKCWISEDIDENYVNFLWVDWWNNGSLLIKEIQFLIAGMKLGEKFSCYNSSPHVQFSSKIISVIFSQ
jgi:hypothetical protein